MGSRMFQMVPEGSMDSIGPASAASPKVLRTPCRLGRDSQAFQNERSKHLETPCRLMQIIFQNDLKLILSWDLLCMSESVRKGSGSLMISYDIHAFIHGSFSSDTILNADIWHANCCSMVLYGAVAPNLVTTLDAHLFEKRQPQDGIFWLLQVPQSQVCSLQLSAWKAGLIKQCKDNVKTM